LGVVALLLGEGFRGVEVELVDDEQQVFVRLQVNVQFLPRQE
jgi:hypothetical protein